ncbi:ABC transporter permease [Ravibacter arvi]|uniref:ABC transporter permease n=1 Tax=Ravibacter arvi TaxID=2051041 RepID=A0ABP8LVX7_9BACT
MNHIENVREGIRSIQGNVLRTVLTAMIIAIGITSLVGILTAVDGIQKSVNATFAELGSNTFTIVNNFDPWSRNRGRSAKINPPITYRQATLFAAKFKEKYDAKVSVFANVSGAVEVKFASKKTNPNINVIGVDEDYLPINGYKIGAGRNVNKSDLENSMNVAVLGQELARNLFGDADPVGSYISFLGGRFQVVGMLDKKGELGGGTGPDRVLLVPLTTGRALAPNRALTYTITASPPDVFEGETILAEAAGLMRNIRNDQIGQDDSFLIERADALAKNFEEITGYLRIGGFVIGLITLLGASIALMNIMMVSVTERTREIGIRKSLGATPRVIRFQFLSEAVIICLLGGLGGLLLGLVIGNLLSTVVSQGTSGFVFPWLWMILGMVVCVIVGILSGVYPAIKASKLDPIEALRYE